MMALYFSCLLLGSVCSGSSVVGKGRIERDQRVQDVQVARGDDNMRPFRQV